VECWSFFDGPHADHKGGFGRCVTPALFVPDSPRSIALISFILAYRSWTLLYLLQRIIYSMVSSLISVIISSMYASVYSSRQRTHITEMSSFRAHNFDISKQKSPSFCFCRILKLAASFNSLRNGTGFRNCWIRKRFKDFHEWSNDIIGPLIPSHKPIHLLHPLFYISIAPREIEYTRISCG
jgi:hypothetical protein